MRCAGGLLTATLLLSSGCTRPNPAFGWLDTTASEGATSTSEHGSTSADEGTTKSTSTSDATQATLGSESLPTDDSTDPTPSCEPHALPFDVIVRDPRNEEVVPPCGESLALAGKVVSERGAEALAVSACADDQCNCGADAIYTFEFFDLDLAPTHAMVEQSCVYVSIEWTSAATGCTVASVLMEQTTGDVDHPSYMASNSPLPPPGLLLPPITIAEPLEPCEQHDCEPSRPPGFYHLFIGDEGPIAPGQPVKIGLNPYAAGMVAVFDFVALFAVVDEACDPHAGWAAVLTE